MLDLNNNRTTSASFNDLDNIDGSDQEQFDDRTVLSIADLPDAFFDNPDLKGEFEQLFKAYDSNIKVNYLKNFKKVRITFNNKSNAEIAQAKLQQTLFHGQLLKIFLIQVPRISQEDRFLRLPKATKQYLLSPPASPPVDWEPITESAPHIDYQLLSAVTELAPGEEHELHKGTKSTPSVVVFCCEDDNEIQRPSAGLSFKSQPFHTKRPDIR